MTDSFSTSSVKNMMNKKSSEVVMVDIGSHIKQSVTKKLYMCNYKL